MELKITEFSIEQLGSLSSVALEEFWFYADAISAADNMTDLTALLPGDVTIVNENSFTIVIKENYQHVVACIIAEIDNKMEITISLQLYA